MDGGEYFHNIHSAVNILKDQCDYLLLIFACFRVGQQIVSFFKILRAEGIHATQIQHNKMGVCGYQENYDLYDMAKDELVNTGKSFREEHFCKTF